MKYLHLANYLWLFLLKPDRTRRPYIHTNRCLGKCNDQVGP